MKVVTIVGARPQFVKAAALSRVIRKEHTEVLVHTGQHYDNNMSDIFFEELHIPKPDYNLGVGSGSHAKQTGDMMIGIEDILMREKPDYIVLYGDTNSTLAGALAASKIHVPIIHIEAGLRSFNNMMPEEINRILTDRISKLLFCPTDTAVENLRNEGITKGVYNVGDVMCDAVLYYSRLIEQQGRNYFFKRLEKLTSQPDPEKWYLATIHRAENTDDVKKIKCILDAFEEFEHPVIFPVHPRTRKMAMDMMEKYNYQNVIVTQPVGYMDMLFLAKHAEKIVTDSGGLQKEAYILKTPCVTVRAQTEWVETLRGNQNILCRPDKEDILDKVYRINVDKDYTKNYYGDGHASEKIVNLIK